MAISQWVHVARRYQRAIRIDADFGDVSALKGFVCPLSSAELLETMAHHVLETGQGAFTWTGPYGGGKSSLAVVLGAILNGDPELRSEATAILGEKTSSLLLKNLPPRRDGWHVLPVSGRRDRPVQVLGEAIVTAGLLKGGRPPSSWSEKHLLDTLTEIAARNPRSNGGLAVFIDELGKFLEGAVRDGTDIHVFQQLAELASRSGRRMLVVGILHQAFDEYAHRLARETRDEWAKIQGRFIDLSVNPDGNEQIDLLARAIESNYRSRSISRLAKEVVGLIRGNSPPHLATMLEDCWPIHPMTACLLGPLSRRRFGQNQRSLFGFLNSAEPFGFRDFLVDASENDLYTPDWLWDYLQINLEPSILVSPDGHRWSLAADALGRCEAMGGSELHLRLLKIIALADLLKTRSRLPASRDLLELALPDQDSKAIGEALDDLRKWSLIAFRKFASAWTIFEGSDFDIDEALEQAVQHVADMELASIEEVISFQPMVAKRHYHETGALRWFDVRIVPISELERSIRIYEPRYGAIGCFILAIPTHGELKERAIRICAEAALIGGDEDVVIGLSPRAWTIPSLVSELMALERVHEDHPELRGDRVARSEVLARIGVVKERLETDLARAFDSASWYLRGETGSTMSRAELNGFASDLADAKFFNAPVLHNELLARVKPSSNAVAARNSLLRRMVLFGQDERLGIRGFPAEGGLYVSLLRATGLHCKTAEGWRFVSPGANNVDPNRLGTLWNAARELLQVNSDRVVPISELYQLWRLAPFGVKDGLLPVLAVAFLLSEHENLAFYRQGVFQSRLSDLDVDYLAKNPADIEVRWMDLSRISRNLLSALADVVRDLDAENKLRCLEPIDVARGLVSIYDSLPPWVHRTQRLSRNTMRIRHLFKQAKDPNKLIFDDMPKLCSGTEEGHERTPAFEVANAVRDGLVEMRDSFPAMLGRLRETLLAELQVPTTAPAIIQELRDRAVNVRDLSGDHRLEAFIMRLARFNGSDADMEELAGLAVNKPVYAWVDLDIDRAMVELSDMAQRFVRTEAFAHVKGRRDKRHAMAVVVGLAHSLTPLHREFQVSDIERYSVEALVETIGMVLHANGEERRNVILAALAEVSARYLEETGSSSVSNTDKRKQSKR